MFGIGYIELLIIGLVCVMPLFALVLFAFGTIMSKQNRHGLAPCPGCGKLIPPHSAVCHLCGKALR